ncbi:MAG: VOC family protein [Peptostreptococcaceae bacterium]|nr:VOC family protein [Peptostreptococcaceae bacterium]
MKKVHVILNFDRCAEEAFRFYEKVFKTQIKTIFKVKDAPNKDDFPTEDQDCAVWIDMDLGNLSLHGEDLGFFSRTGDLEKPDRSQYPGQFITIDMDTKEELIRVFDALAERGKVVYPLEPTFFSEYYGRLIDRYGVGWEVML